MGRSKSTQPIVSCRSWAASVSMRMRRDWVRPGAALDGHRYHRKTAPRWTWLSKRRATASMLFRAQASDTSRNGVLRVRHRRPNAVVRSSRLGRCCARSSSGSPGGVWRSAAVGLVIWTTGCCSGVERRVGALAGEPETCLRASMARRFGMHLSKFRRQPAWPAQLWVRRK